MFEQAGANKDRQIGGQTAASRPREGERLRRVPSWGGMQFPPGDLDDLIFYDAIVLPHSER